MHHRCCATTISYSNLSERLLQKPVQRVGAASRPELQGDQQHSSSRRIRHARRSQQYCDTGEPEHSTLLARRGVARSQQLGYWIANQCLLECPASRIVVSWSEQPVWSQLWGRSEQ